MSKKKLWGIVILVINIIVFIGTISDNANDFNPIQMLILWPSAIGVYLLISDYKEKEPDKANIIAKYVIYFYGIAIFIIGLACIDYALPLGILLIIVGVIITLSQPYINYLKTKEEKEQIEEEIKKTELKEILERIIKLEESELQTLENSMHEDIKESIDGILVHVSMLSGIPVKKINKEKAIDSIYKYLLQTNHTDELTLTKDTMNIVWSIAKENNQFKEIKLQDSAPNSKIRIKLNEILNKSAEILRSRNLHVSKNSIKEASNLIAMYIDKYVFSEPTIEQEEDMTIPILFYCLAEKENEDNIINNFGINFYNQLMRSSMSFLMVYRKSLITDFAPPSSPEFINASNNFNYYLDILLKENKK